MESRKVITVGLIFLVVIAGSIALVITIQDYEQIIKDLNETTFNPPNPPGDSDDSDNQDEHEIGLLNLYYVSNLSTEKNSVPIRYLPINESSNDSLKIEEAILKVSNVKLIGKNTKNVSFSNDEFNIDLTVALNSSELIKKVNISTGFYSAIQLFYDDQISIKIDGENQILDIQGSGFVVIPFIESKTKNETKDLEIKANMTEYIYLDFMLNINLIKQIAIVNILAFLDLE